MHIIDKKTNKKTKLHIRNCVFCKQEFGCYRNATKVCSMKCKSKLNGLTKTKGLFRECKTCKNKFWHKPSEDRRGSVHEYCSMKCVFPNKKLNLPLGEYLSYDGYAVINRTSDGRKQIKKHRYIIEQHIGRRLNPTEIVHHIDENKLNNNIINLQIVSRSEHNKIHEFLKKRS